MKISNEAKIGIMVTGVIIILATLTVKTGKLDFSKQGYSLKVYFTNVDGINKNAPVMLNGLESGVVENISIKEVEGETKMELLVFMEEHAKIKEGAKAYVKNMGFMGEKYIGITTGQKGAGYLSADSVIMGEDPADLDSLLLDGQEIAVQIKEISQNLNERLKVNKERIDTIVANLDVTMENAASITDKVDQGNIDKTLANLNSASTHLDQFTYDLKLHPWKLLYRSKEKRAKSIRLLEEENKQ